MPDIGPKPIRMTKNIAHIIEGRLLIEASRNRVATESPGVLMLFAANKERGSDITIPKTVDMKAIFRVSIIPIHAVEHVIDSPPGAWQSGYNLGSKILQSGGHKDSKKKTLRFPNPFESRPQSSTDPIIRYNARQKQESNTSPGLIRSIPVTS